VSNHCVFTWQNATPLAAGASKTFNYSTDSQSFNAATAVTVNDRVCNGGAASCSTFAVVENVYDGPSWWGTIGIANDGPSTASTYQVQFDVPAGVHCTAEADAVPSGATLSPLAGSGTPDHTISNHCVFTWTDAPVGAGSTKTFNYSTDSQ